MLKENEPFKILSSLEANKLATTTNAKPLNVLLVELINDHFQYFSFPLQLFVLAGSIVQRGVDGKVIKRQHNITIAQSSSPDGVTKYIGTKAQTGYFADVLAISAHHGNWNNLNKTLSSLRSIPNGQRPHVIIGGYLASHLCGELLDKYTDIPININIGHGDVPFRSFVDGLCIQDNETDTYGIPGIVSPGERILLPSVINANNYPWLDGIPLGDNTTNRVARMETSRGCFYNHCIFCDRPSQREWVKYSLDDVMRQMAALAELGYNKFTFSDEEIVGDEPKRFAELLLRIKELRTRYPDLEFFLNARADNIVSAKEEDQGTFDEIWESAKEAGVVLVWVGAESYSPRQLKIYNKGVGISPQSNLDSLKRLNSFGIKVVQGFIPFHPLMSKDELHENIDFISRHHKVIVPSLDNPLGFLRVNPNTGYLRYLLKQQEKSKTDLIKGFDPNTLSYQCAYLDPDLGLLVSFLYSINAFTRPGTKHIQWDGNTDQKLIQMRYLNFNLLRRSFECMADSTSHKDFEAKLVTDLLPWYQKAATGIGIEGASGDFQAEFSSEFDKNKQIFIA